MRGLTKKVQRPNLRPDAERRREIIAVREETGPCRLGPLEPTVRPSPSLLPPEHALRWDLSLVEQEREFMPTSPKEKCRGYCVKVKG
jgi:hypothetical protein